MKIYNPNLKPELAIAISTAVMAGGLGLIAVTLVALEKPKPALLIGAVSLGIAKYSDMMSAHIHEREVAFRKECNL